MGWPKVDEQKTFCELEEEFRIDAERDDVRPWNLGHHPSQSYYGKPEPDFEATRREYDRKVAASRRG